MFRRAYWRRLGILSFLNPFTSLTSLSFIGKQRSLGLFVPISVCLTWLLINNPCRRTLPTLAVFSSSQFISLTTTLSSRRGWTLQLGFTILTSTLMAQSAANISISCTSNGVQLWQFQRVCRPLISSSHKNPFVKREHSFGAFATCWYED